MRRACVVAVSLVLAVAGPLVAADTPTVRPLDPDADAAPAARDEEPARTLPPSVAVCREPGGSRCWTKPFAEDCARDGGTVFRVVLGDADGRDAATALRQCRAAAELEKRRPPDRGSIPEAR
jgi:hypothetical protein